jgi:hypothetical protein
MDIESRVGGYRKAADTERVELDAAVARHISGFGLSKSEDSVDRRPIQEPIDAIAQTEPNKVTDQSALVCEVVGHTKRNFFSFGNSKLSSCPCCTPEWHLTVEEMEMLGRKEVAEERSSAGSSRDRWANILGENAMESGEEGFD